MARKLGIWIDHREAVMVVVDNGDVRIKRLESNAESNVNPSEGWKGSGTGVPQSISQEKKAQGRRRHQYRAYYQNVLKEIRKAEQVYLLGPGEAKRELKKEMDKHKDQQGKLLAVEPCDRVIESQLIAKVKTFYRV